MSSDDAYSSFLDQANQNSGVSKASAKSSSAPPTKAVDTDVPASLSKIEQYYVSDADEPFEPVSLKWSGNNMSSENEFKDLIEHTSEISTMTVQEFDPREQYSEVFKAVENSGDGKARIFRVLHGSTRIEYYVVGFDKNGKRIVGLKAKAVES